MKIATRRQLLSDDSPIAHKVQGIYDATTRHRSKPAKNGKPVVASLAALLLLAIGSGSAIAQAAPDNDLLDFATPAIAGDDYGTLDTTLANTDADDIQLNQYCGYPATDASVWYKYEASSDIGVFVDVTGSNYSADVIIATGTPASLDVVACYGGPFRAEAGQNYYIVVFDSQYDEGGNGGDLRISFTELQVAVIGDITINRSGQFNSKTGIATISGTYTCSYGSEFYFYLGATQTVGRLIITGNNHSYANAECDQQPHPWTVEVQGGNGKFAGGRLTTSLYSNLCAINDPYYYYFCASDYTEGQKVQLSGGSKK